MEVMNLMVVGVEGCEKKILCEHPHSTWDNYFNGYQIINWLVGNGFGAMMPCSRGRLPGDIEGKYLHTKNRLL